MDNIINVLLTNWDVIGLILTNIAALFAPSPIKKK